MKKANEDAENYEVKGSFVLDVMNTTEITKRQVAAENVIKEIIRQYRNEGIDVAFPSQSIYLTNEN